MKEAILEEFKSKKYLLDSYRDKTLSLLTEILKQNNINLHQLTCRTKDIDSLAKKMDRKEGKYKSLDQITDIVGIRVITYLESEVDAIAEILESEFKIDFENSIDKRKMALNEFGYKSLHYVTSISDSRCQFTEYKSYKGLKCEIQVRSILQHAWAEIEHDLGYKGKASIPEEYVRSFNRLAALLETADIEFDRLKKELTIYEQNVELLIQTKPEEVTINQASLHSFLLSNPIVTEANNIIQEHTNTTFTYDKSYNGTIERFNYFNIKTIKELEELLQKDKSEYLAFVEAFVKQSMSSKHNNDLSNLSIDISLFYFQHYLAAKTQDLTQIKQYLSENKIGTFTYTAKDYIDLYSQLNKSI